MKVKRKKHTSNISFVVSVYCIVSLILLGCSKSDGLMDSNVTDNTRSSQSNARVGRNNNLDSLYYYANLASPTRDLKSISLNLGQESQMTPLAGGGDPSDCYQPPACNGITFPLHPGWSCDPLPERDEFNNIINAYGHYGADPRQLYYVSYPSGKHANSPIVVLIHGGGWFQGPNPATTQGNVFGFSKDPQTESLVKDLVDNGYVVVSLLYRLVKYGNNAAERASNTTTWQTQIDDIDAAMMHIRDNFPTCLGLNANSIQVLGESAGGHLALMWAYTKTSISPTILKSVISMYAPTNLQQYGAFLQSKATGIYTCGNTIFDACLKSLFHFPFYFPLDISNIKNTYNSFNLNCIPSATCLLNNPSVLNNIRIIDSYNMIQSAMSQEIPAPNSSSVLAQYSPANALNVSRIIPTFIMHGDGGSDHLVPYNQATTGMNTKLSSTGGLIATLNTTNASVGYDFGTLSNKHLIKLFPNAEHGWVNLTDSDLDNLRSNVVTWFNGHK